MFNIFHQQKGVFNYTIFIITSLFYSYVQRYAPAGDILVVCRATESLS
jgi:hypothetical protein